jgi:ribosomal protein L9
LAISEKSGAEVSAEAIILEKPVKSLGLHHIQIRLAQNVKAEVILDVEAI